MAENAPALEAVPWEFLHDQEGFLVANRQVLLSRAAAGLADLDLPAAGDGPLRILAIVSQPLDLPDEQGFEADDELAVIYEALDEPLRRGQIVVDVVNEASPIEIQRALIRQDYHVVHFIGHGDFDERQGGYLVIEDAAGNAARMGGAAFTNLLAGRGVRLVLLSSCLTARASSTTAYRSVAGALLRQGLPAAVAMQYPIAVVAARAFYHTVYTALAANRPLDLAVAEGRQSLALQAEAAGRPLEWATPALFERLSGGWRLGIDARGVAPPTPERQWLSMGELQLMSRGFVGRHREQRQIRRAFLRDGARAVLIHGFGGMGKTVLAGRVAQRLVEGGRFDGAVGLRARQGVAPDEVLRDLNTFLLARGVESFAPVLAAPIPLAQKLDVLVQILRGMRVIVILDNCEDWLEERQGRHEIANSDLAVLLERLTSGLERGSKLLLTSRRAFNLLPPGRLTGAVVNVPLGELPQGEAVRLMGTLPGLRECDYDTRLRVFRALAGHPFVLNIFAERSHRDGVEHALADVRDLRREAEDVGQWLLQQIVDGLAEATRRLLLRASVLRRPAPREALEALAGTHRIGPALDEMVGWSLLAADQFEDELCDAPEQRYVMHAFVRDHCGPRLGQGEERREALLVLAQCYRQRSEETEYVDVAVFNRLEARHYAYAAGEYRMAGVIDQNVTKYLVRWGLLDTARELNRQTAIQGSGVVRAAALLHWGIVEQSQGNYSEALRLYEQSRELAEALGDKAGLAFILHQLGILQHVQGNYDEALRLYEESRQLKEALGDKAGLASSLHQLGTLQHRQGNYGEALRLYEESRKFLEVLGDKAGLAMSLHQLGMLQQHQGNYDEALRLYEESRQLKEALGDKAGLASSLHQLGNLHYLQGNHGEALRLYEESRKLREALGDKAGLASTLGQLGQLAQAQGLLKEAMRYYLHALASFQAINSSNAQLVAQLLGEIQAEVGTAQFSTWWQELTGSPLDLPADEEPASMSLEQATDWIVDETIAVLAKEDPGQRSQWSQALGDVRSQVEGQPENADFTAFVDAVRQWVEGHKPPSVALPARFDAAWRRIEEGLSA